MDLNQIYYFISVVECGSYTKAAQKLSIPKSTLSRHVQALEDSVKVRLLNRSTRKLSLTKAGEAFFVNSLPLVTNLQNIHADISQYHKDVTGQLRVTMPPEVGTGFLCSVLPNFLEQHPKIRLEFDFSTSKKNLIEEGFDLAIRIGELEDSSYIARKIGSPKMGLYASPGYLMSSPPLEEVEQINLHQHIVTNIADGYLCIEGHEPIMRKNVQISSNSLTFNKQMCIEGLGVALMPQLLCENEVRSGQLIQVMTNYHFIQVNIYAVYPSRNNPSKALSTFIDFISSEISTIHSMN